MNPALRASFTLLLVLAGVAPVVASPERSVSTSRQFLVYGADIRLRGAICDLAERTKRDLLQVIGLRDQWTAPIVIHTQYPQVNLPEEPPVKLRLSQTGAGLKFQLELWIGSDVTPQEIRRELLSIILCEMMYRRAPDLPASTAYVPPPDWLLDGLQMHTRSMTDALATAAAHKILPLDQFLRQDPKLLDSPSRSLYCAYSFALVGLLTELPDGRRRLVRFIFDLPSSSGDALGDLRTHFPELADANGFAEKTWASWIARLAAVPSCPFLGAEESGRILNEMLSLRISDADPGKRYRLDEFSKFIRDSSARSALARLSRALSVFAVRADPAYRPAIYEYARVATLLARGKTGGIAERLARLSASRKAIAVHRRKIDDYMNWFEATKSVKPSGTFADYMKAAEAESQPAKRKRDPISVYLDVLEAQLKE